VGWSSRCRSLRLAWSCQLAKSSLCRLTWPTSLPSIAGRCAIKPHSAGHLHVGRHTRSPIMPAIRPSELPETALLRKYQNGSGYADCYSVEVPAAVSHAESSLRPFIRQTYSSSNAQFSRGLPLAHQPMRRPSHSPQEAQPVSRHGVWKAVVQTNCLWLTYLAEHDPG
jgi:hypothetical protein